MIHLESINNYLKEFEAVIKNPKTDFDKNNFHVGVDLGTANIVISIINNDGTPLAGATKSSTAIKDGVVVDFLQAVSVVKELKLKLEKDLNIEITKGYTAIPPGIDMGTIKVIRNVVECAEIDVIDIVDEPTAAAYVLGIQNGAVVDVGGGTTGISIIKNGEIIFTADEPTGGTHMTLVLSGNYNISIEDAEVIKKDLKKEKQNFGIVQPVIEKMALIVKKFLNNFDVEDIYIVGGAVSFTETEKIFNKITNKNIIKPYKPLLVTPLGIALAALKK